VHELSVALEVCRIAEQRLNPTDLPLLITVGVEVGHDAGVEPDNLRFCLEALLAAPPFAGAQPVITRLPGDVLRLAYLELDDGSTDD
jgi:Zn finger protein HypA/HybF involved in hydrogenase expression